MPRGVYLNMRSREPVGPIALQQLRETLAVAVIAALSMVTKPYVRMAFAPLAGSVGVPVGVFAGCIYMMWVVLVDRLGFRPGAVVRLSVLQGLLALAMGMTSQAGPMILVTYLAPGLAVEGLRLMVPPDRRKQPYSMAAGAIANIAGSATMTLVIAGWKPAVILAALPVSLLGGAMGGALSHALAHRLRAIALPVPAAAARPRG